MMSYTFEHKRLNQKKILGKTSTLRYLIRGTLLHVNYNKATENILKTLIKDQFPCSWVTFALGKVTQHIWVRVVNKKNNLQVDGLVWFLEVWDTIFTFYFPSDVWIRIFKFIYCHIYSLYQHFFKKDNRTHSPPSLYALARTVAIISCLNSLSLLFYFFWLLTRESKFNPKLLERVEKTSNYNVL